MKKPNRPQVARTTALTSAQLARCVGGARESEVVNNPLYTPSPGSGENPLYG